jgi:hypothetical protein
LFLGITNHACGGRFEKLSAEREVLFSQHLLFLLVTCTLIIFSFGFLGSKVSSYLLYLSIFVV